LTKPVRESAMLHTLAQKLASETTELQVARQSHVPGPGGLQILLAEDNTINEVYAARLLANLGHQVTAVHDGSEALEAAKSQQFDLIFMDIEMPTMDGFSGTRAIREAEAGSGRHVPIIALTAHSLQGFREKCLAAGMDDFLVKPIQTDGLLAMIQRYAPDRPSADRSENEPDRSDQPAPIRNAETALKWIAGNRSMLPQLAAAFAQESPRLLSEIREAVAARQARPAFTAVRTLQDSLRYLDAQPALQCLQKLEQALRAEDYALAESLLAEMERRVELLDSALARIGSA
jgi:CheY-like chemotaxis protein/HPt (histidine-containing phosphotransfer) domain-containing protein